MIAEKKILVRADGGERADVGTGHIARSLLIASRLRTRHQIFFASIAADDLEWGHRRIQSEGYQLILICERTYLEQLSSVLEQMRPDFVVCDLYSYTEQEMLVYKRHHLPVMTFDHTDRHSEYSTFAINAVHPQNAGPYCGPDYFVFPPPLANDSAKGGIDSDLTGPGSISNADCVQKIFICFGGYDHLGLSEKACHAILRAGFHGDIQLVIGNTGPESGFSEEKRTELIKNLDESGIHLSIYVNPENFRELIASADLALTAGGLTLFEVLSYGKPVLVLCQYEHQRKTMLDFQSADAFINAGMGDSLEEEQLTAILRNLLSSSERRAELARNARRLVDGGGLDRVVRLIETELSN